MRTLEVDARDKRALRDAGERLVRCDLDADADAFVLEAQLESARLSRELRRALLAFRRFGDPSGGLLVRGIALGAVPPTPTQTSAARLAAPGAAGGSMSTVLALLGDQYAFRAESAGALIQQIIPIAGFEGEQISVGSTAELELHVETAFSDYRPDYVALLCLRAASSGAAATTLASIDAILPLLEGKHIEVLREPRFRTGVDMSFLIGDSRIRDPWVEPICVIQGPLTRPRIRVDFAGTEGADDVAAAALEELRAAAARVQQRVELAAGDLLIIDNNRAVHGRAPFAPRYDGTDRWLLRSFATRDLSRSDRARPADGRVIDTHAVA